MKKAIAVTELTIIILAVAAGIGLIFLATKGAEKAGCMSDVTVCKQSLIAYKKIREVVGAVPYKVDCVAISPPNCEEKELKAENKPMTMFIIAENLKYCWDKTLGRENTIGEDFATAWYAPKPFAPTDVDFCLVCSEFIPKVDVPDADWTAYLENQKMPNSDMTYAKFVNPADPISPWGQKYKDYGRPFAFEKGKKYYVVSVSAEATKGDKAVYIYIEPEVNCGSNNPIIHYQLK